MSLASTTPPVDSGIRAGVDVERDIAIHAKDVMNRKRITSRTVAAEMHLHPNRLSERMTGKARFSVAETVDLARILDVPLGVLLDRAEHAVWVQNWK